MGNGEWGVHSYYHNPYLIFIFYACVTPIIRLRHNGGLMEGNGQWGVKSNDYVDDQGQWWVYKWNKLNLNFRFYACVTPIIRG